MQPSSLPKQMARSKSVVPGSDAGLTGQLPWQVRGNATRRLTLDFSASNHNFYGDKTPF